MHEQRDAVRQGDQPEGEKFVEPDRLAMDAAQVDNEPADSCTAEGAHDEPRRPPPIPGRSSPSPAKSPSSCVPISPSPSMTKGKAVPSFKPRFAGQAEPNGFGVVLVRDLHVGGEDRIGRRQDRAQQHRGAERQPTTSTPNAAIPRR